MAPTRPLHKLSLLTRPQTSLKFSDLKLNHPYQIDRFEESSTRHGDQIIESIAVYIQFSSGPQEPKSSRKIFLPKRFDKIRNEIPELNSLLEEGAVRLTLKWCGPCGSTNIVDIAEEE